MTASIQQHPRRTPTWIRKLVIGSVAVVSAIWLVECVYYYNTFVGMTSKLAGDLSDCEVAMQERHHHFAAVLSFERRPFMAIDPAGLKFREAAF